MAKKSSDKYTLSKEDSFIAIQKRDAYPNTFLIQDDQKYLIGYADAQTLAIIQAMGANLSHDELLSNLDREFLVVLLDTKAGSIQIMRDALCTMPVFVYMNSELLVASNDYAVLMSHLPTLGVSHKALLRHLLLLDNPKEKIIKDTFCLSQVESLRYDALSQQVTEAPLSEFADLPEYDDQAPRLFKRIFEEHLDNFWQTRLQGQRIGFELSGGFDSSLTPGYYSGRGVGKLQTYTIGFLGDDFEAQSQKIQALKRRFDIDNQTLQIRVPEHVPLLHSPKGHMNTIDRSAYLEVTEDFVDMLADNGTQVIVTGVGGDEFCTIHKPEKIPTYTTIDSLTLGRACVPTAISASARNIYSDGLIDAYMRRGPYVPASVSYLYMMLFNIYIRRGIWPVSPYVSPKCLYFMRHMPPKYLLERKIIQAYLRVSGFPPEIYNRTSNEDFGSFLRHCMRSEWSSVWTECLENSVLINQGFVTRQDALHNYRQGQYDASYFGFWVYRFMELERFLRRPGIMLEPLH